jgi:uncharacterized lipoprotein YddW (UPF0748 family)
MRQLASILVVTLTVFASACKPAVQSQVNAADGAGGTPVGEVRAVWLTHHDFLGKPDAALQALIKRLKAANVNTVYLAVYSKGMTFWPSPTMKAVGGATTQLPWAHTMNQLLHKNGFWVGAWFEYGLAGGRASNAIVKAHPEWFQRSAAGRAESPENGGFYFFSPSNPSVQRFINGLLGEIARMGFDEIQFDRFRWTASSTKGVTDFGYEDSTLQPYLKKYKQPSTKRPAPNSVPWMAWRKAALNKFVASASASVRSVNPNIVVSASPVGYYGVGHFLQDWRDWLKSRSVDVVFPQMYAHNTREFVTHLVEVQKLMKGAGISNAGERRLVGAGLLLNGAASDGDEQRFFAMARKAGFHDFSLWLYNPSKGKLVGNADVQNLTTQRVLWKSESMNPRTRGVTLRAPGSAEASPALESVETPLQEEGVESVPASNSDTAVAGVGEAAAEPAVNQEMLPTSVPGWSVEMKELPGEIPSSVSQ